MLFKPQQKEIPYVPDYACTMYSKGKKNSYVSKTREVNENFKLAFHMYLNEVFDYLSFLGYHCRCWQLLFGGEGGKQHSKTKS